MNYKDNVLIISLLFVIGAITASGLKCHVCNSINVGQEDCHQIAEDNTKYLMDCTAPFNHSCRTQQQWIEFEVLNQNTDKRTVRQCASTPFDPDRICYYRAGFGGKVNVCHCTGDGCNEASKTASTILLIIGLLLAAGLFS